MNARILHGLRVVEWGGGVAAAYSGRLLAALGADVVKVEPPEGDPLRHRGPYPPGHESPDTAGLHLYLNAGKLSVVQSRCFQIASKLEAKCALLDVRCSLIPMNGAGPL